MVIEIKNLNEDPKRDPFLFDQIVFNRKLFVIL